MPDPKQRMGTGTKVAIAIFVLFLLAGAGLGIYFLVIRKRPPPSPPSPPSPAPSPPASPCSVYTSLSGVDTTGFDISGASQAGQSESQCQNICSTNANCQWYSYATDTQTCSPKQATANADMITAFKISNPATGCASYTRYTGFDTPGFDITGASKTNQTEQQCQAICNSNPNCNWYTYSQSKQICNPKQAASKSNNNIGFIGSPLLR